VITCPSPRLPISPTATQFPCQKGRTAELRAEELSRGKWKFGKMVGKKYVVASGRASAIIKYAKLELESMQYA
jgi:hypothetical protein